MKTRIMGIMAIIAVVVGCKAQKNFASVDANTFEQTLMGGNVVCLDVRTIDEFNEGHIMDAINIDVKQADFEQRATTALPKEKTIAVYCRSGRRSKKACDILANNGFKVVELADGIIGWQQSNKRVTTEVADAYTTPNGIKFALCSFKHASLRIQIGEKWLYVDPVTDKIQPATDYTTMPQADIILITHEHADHLDAKAIEQLTKDGTMLIVNPRSSEQLGGKGEVMRNGESKNIDSWTLAAVPAYNTSADKQQFHPKGRDNGYVLTIDDLRVYIAGDTENIDEMGDLKDVDIAFLPCNLPFTMTPEQLAKAAKTINPKLLYVYHYGQTDLAQVRKALEGSGIDVRFRKYQ